MPGDPSKVSRGQSSTAKRREPSATTGLSPFHLAAMEYFAAGFLPFPLPMGKKYPPPKGVPNSIVIDEEQVAKWLADPRPRNIGAIVQDGIVVIDIDGQPGKESLRELEARYGELSNTWITFHGDPDHYHLWYRTPTGLHWPGKLGAGIDVIHRHYRYVVLPPSIHPDGTQYRWAKP